MARVVFVCAGASNLVVLLAVAGVGLVAEEDAIELHILLAVFTLIVSCFVQTAVFTYLTVTGKAIHQAVALAKLGEGPLDEVSRIKRPMPALIATVMIPSVGAVITGALTFRADESLVIHPILATLVILTHSFALYREFDLVARTGELMQRSMAAYSESKERQRRDQ